MQGEKRNDISKNKKIARIVISLMVVCGAIFLLVNMLSTTGKKVGKDDKYDNTAEESKDKDSVAKPVLTAEEAKMVKDVRDRIQEVYNSNGLMYINFTGDASESAPVVFRNTGEAYMEYGDEIRVYLNNKKAVVASNPVQIIEEATPLELMKGMLECIELGTGKIEKVTNKGNSAIKLSMNSLDAIIKAYSYISSDYAWLVMSGYGIKEGDNVKMEVYLYDKTGTVKNKSADSKLYNTWVQFETECIFNVNDKNYSSWWTIGAEKLNDAFKLRDEYYKLTDKSSMDKWQDIIKETSVSVKSLLKELNKTSKSSTSKDTSGK